MALREMSHPKGDENSVVDDERERTAGRHLAIRPRGRRYGHWVDQHEAYFQHGECPLGVWFL
jgi:hypothetical protein